MSKKRTRTSNFNGAEEDILIQCILKHATIIESKKTDACTLKEKQHAWHKVENEFNSLCPNVARQRKSLKDKYTNIKTILRKELAAEKVNRKATGGGKRIPKSRPRSEAMAELANLISMSIDGTPATFENVVIDDNSLPSISSEPSASKSCSKYTPTMLLREPNSFQLKRSTSAASSPRNDKKDSLQDLNKKLIERELEMCEIEHQTRLYQQQVEHKARMTLLEAQTIDFKTKIKLRRLRIAKLRKDQRFETESDSE